MRSLVRPAALIRAAALIALAAACAPRHPSGQAAPLPNREVLTSGDLSGKGFSTVLEALQALRPQWLQGRGPDSFSTPSEVRVFLDSNELGGVDALSVVQLASVVYIRHYDGVAASARWGIGHSQGVIYIATHPDDHPI
ncbi:MAG TPA: hypothetical protein VMF70_07675 [Gemmatimonadales bacterium]|nr:hypothetical protein [Gemmatimonadales bacterium]